MNNIRNSSFRCTVSVLSLLVAVALSNSAVSANLQQYALPYKRPVNWYNVNVTLVPAVTYCVHLIFTQPGAGYAELENECPFGVYVEFFDQLDCTRGCGAVVYANGESEIHYNGAVRYAACKLSEGLVVTGAGFQCRSYGGVP